MICFYLRVFALPTWIYALGVHKKSLLRMTDMEVGNADNARLQGFMPFGYAGVRTTQETKSRSIYLPLRPRH